ncbi:Hypothetical Protein FCC1311_062882 [Hondaea fermentalgiana]|uniref:Uncharacterized protein n=1 Tax=Hondaea fermentalgiana TaxID=2315210 RepID=A0A2R5GK17_9STRA|nr:Hypothetical Protein FCC1311_062882 [Hondaea fermentalgiana]|eukprot:GBG30068.1 Hypothetical Protein FCC1311_062882 [Hondaea fermentalgiana]
MGSAKIASVEYDDSESYELESESEPELGSESDAESDASESDSESDSEDEDAEEAVLPDAEEDVADCAFRADVVVAAG